MPSKEVKELLKELAEHPGVREITENKGHHKVWPVDISKSVVTIPGTPSDHRWLQNAKRDLRSSGIELRKK